jgi:hypothetical protein
MTLGSFIGNALTVWSLTRFGAPLQIVAVFTVFNLSWLLIWYGNPGRGLGSERTSARVAGSLGEVVRNRGFIRDIVRLFGALVPYGCWGTLLPKLVLDKFGNLSAIPLLYFASMTTIVTLTHLFNQGLAARLHKSGFDKRHWTSIAFLLFISGILMIGLSNSIAVMCVGAIVFALGEIVVTPRMDEATKENASDKPASIYIGWVQFVEGAARLIGAGIGLLIYGALASAAPVQHFSLSLCAVFSAIYAASLFSSRIASRGFSQKTVKGYT